MCISALAISFTVKPSDSKIARHPAIVKGLAPT